MIVIDKFNSFINISMFILICSVSILYSEENCDISSFRINETLFNDEIVAYYLSAIDINSGTSFVPLFEYSIQGDSECYSLNHSSDINLILEYSMNIYSPSIGFNLDQELISGSVGLSNISSDIVFNNMNLNYKTKSVPGAEFNWLDYSGPTDADREDYELIISSVLSSGKVPNGIYTFKFSLKNNTGVVIDELNKTINVNEPEYINLISPGGSLADTLSNTIYSTFPVFTWNSDNCSLCETQIRVCEFNPLEHSSLSDAMNDISHLPNSSSNDEFYAVNDNVNSFQYPTINSKNLESGKLYAWQLKRLYQSTLGQEELLSQIYIFKIFSASSNTDSGNLEIIKLLIGEQKYNELFLENGILSGYNDLEGTIILNGTEVSISELNQVVNLIQNGEINIQDIIVE